MSDIIYLKDYIKSKNGPLTNKIVVGADVRPGQAVNLAMLHSPLQVVTNNFDEQKIVKIKENIGSFVREPGNFILNGEESDLLFQQKFFKNSKKTDFLLQVETFLKQSCFRKLREDIYLIADELFTNFAKSAVEENVSMMFGIDCRGEDVAIYCTDSFGTLRPEMMLENIHRCYVKGVKDSIKDDQENGAGIGSYLMYNLCAGMVLAVQPGQQSLVLLWMPKSVYHEDRIEMNKSLIIINEEVA